MMDSKWIHFITFALKDLGYKWEAAYNNINPKPRVFLEDYLL